MRLAITVIIAGLLTGCAGEPKHPAWSNATGAEQHERLMWQAVREKDWKAVEYHLAPTFVGVDASGSAFDRTTWVEHWKANEIKGFNMAEVSVQPSGTHMVVSYLLRLEGVPGRPAAAPEVAR